MAEIRSKRIAEILDRAQQRFGWDGYVFSFTVGVDWAEPASTYVREASASMQAFLHDYRTQKIQRSHHRLAIVRNDLPQTFDVTRFSDAPLDRQLFGLMTRFGWHTGLAVPQYGYGGALGLTTFVSRKRELEHDAVDACVEYMAGWQMQLNAWAREIVERHNQGLSLSPREAECLTLVAEGKTSRQIATEIGVAPRTVEFHIQNAMQKLGSSSRSHAASLLVQLSLPQLNSAATPHSRSR